MSESGFLWGGATSCAQSEGGFGEGGRGQCHLDFVDYVPPERRIDRRGTFEVSLDRYRANKSLGERLNAPFRRGNDFFHRYKEDLALLAEMGFKCFRTSISWCRLFPTGFEEHPNPEGLSFYRRVFSECRRLGMEPLVTINHYDTPIELVERFNGWESPEIIPHFLKFARAVIDGLGDLVRYWIPFNEINMAMCSPYMGGALFVERSEKGRAHVIHQSIYHKLVASALLVAYARSVNPSARLGAMLGRIEPYPLTCDPRDVARSLLEDQLNLYPVDVMARGFYPPRSISYFKENGFEIERIEDDERILHEGTVDFISISYYMSYVVSGQDEKREPIGDLVKNLKNPYIHSSDWGWGIDPEGLRITLHRLYDRYGLPVFVVENGLGASDTPGDDGRIHDLYRIDYLRDHIGAVRRAIEEGVDVMGFLVWGCIDVPSASLAEMSKRYGLVYVDADDYGRGTYRRQRKDSFFWYQKVIASNGEDLG